MSKLKDKLDFLHKGTQKVKTDGPKDKIKTQWQHIDSKNGLSTKEKLEKLVNRNLKRREKLSKPHAIVPDPEPVGDETGIIIKEYSYPLLTCYGKFQLVEWSNVSSQQLALISGDEGFLTVSPKKLLFFDTETTGISGGTGTIPFMLGFGYFEQEAFKVKIFILEDLNKEDLFLDHVDTFIQGNEFSATVTYNGKGFDFPLMETRYILQRKRFPLLKIPHLDFLYPARMLWKHTYPSRKLGYLGDVLLGISRDDDIDGSQIPMLYFDYLRNRSFSLMQQVVEHNALDLVGLAGLLLLGLKYLEDVSFTQDEGEVLGTANLHERSGHFETAEKLYKTLKKFAVREEVIEKTDKRLSVFLKRKKLYREAVELWEMMSKRSDAQAVRELSVHFEHREKNYFKALEVVNQGMDVLDLTDNQRDDFKKRVKRLNKKIKILEMEDNLDIK
jgi:uncharacterized protein YprB with RNaseH-like and TPR domain